MGSEEEDKVEFCFSYLVTFYFKNRQTVDAIDAVMNAEYDRKELGIPPGWDVKRLNTMQSPWVEFESETLIKRKEASAIRRHLQKLDDAFSAMKK
jgi:hypothetical protein